MNPQILQNLRYKLQKRVRRLSSVEPKMFIPTLRQFWVFFDSHPLLAGIAESLSARVPGCADLVKRIFGNEALVGSTEEEAAAIGLGVLRQLSQGDVGTWFPLARPYGPASKLDEALETIREVFLEPLYEYVDESLDEER